MNLVFHRGTKVMKAGRNPSTFGIFFGGLAYVIEYRNFRAPDACHSGDFYMGSGEGMCVWSKKIPTATGCVLSGNILG